MRPDMLEEETVRFLMVSLGGVLGANARYVVGIWSADRFGNEFPYGTFIVNVTGSIAIGFVLTLVTERIIAHAYWRLFFVTGFLGAYTTFSAYTFESAQLLAEGAVVRGIGNLLGSVIFGMIGVAIGIMAARQL